jgi:hypothetical protein
MSDTGKLTGLVTSWGRSCVLKHVTEVKIEGKIKGKRRRKRISMLLPDGLKEKRRHGT